MYEEVQDIKKLVILVGMMVLSSMVLVRLQSSEAAPIPGFVEAPNGVRLAGKEFGDPDSPTIMLIHGFSQSHLSWNRQFEDLVEMAQKPSPRVGFLCPLVLATWQVAASTPRLQPESRRDGTDLCCSKGAECL
jgi:hypothetical protein